MELEGNYYQAPDVSNRSGENGSFYDASVQMGFYELCGEVIRFCTLECLSLIIVLKGAIVCSVAGYCVQSMALLSHIWWLEFEKRSAYILPIWFKIQAWQLEMIHRNLARRKTFKVVVVLADEGWCSGWTVVPFAGGKK